MSGKPTASQVADKVRLDFLLERCADVNKLTYGNLPESREQIDALLTGTPAEMTKLTADVEKLIEKWSKDPQLQFGVPYRRMATEAAEIFAQAPSAPTAEPNCVVRNKEGQGTHLEYRHPVDLGQCKFWVEAREARSAVASRLLEELFAADEDYGAGFYNSDRWRDAYDQLRELIEEKSP